MIGLRFICLHTNHDSYFPDCKFPEKPHSSFVPVVIESCLSKTPQARRITAPAPNPPYIAQGWRRYPKCARMARFFGYPKTGFYFAAVNNKRIPFVMGICFSGLTITNPGLNDKRCFLPGQSHEKSTNSILFTVDYASAPAC